MLWSSNDTRKMEGRAGCRGEGHGACGLEFGDLGLSLGYAKNEISIRNEHLMIHLILHYIKMEWETDFCHTHSEVEGEIGNV